jgi:tetratricopeptide (TPR) repeat protein
MRLSMHVTIKLFLTAVVVATCPLGSGDGNTASAEPLTSAAQSVSADAGSHATALDACKKLVAEKKFAEARKSCTSAVTLAEMLPAKDWHERSVAYSARGLAELGANAADDAAQDFKKAIEIDEKNLKPEDMMMAIDRANLGRAQLQLGDLESLDFADQNFQKATEALEIDTLNDEARKNEYQRTLKGILVDYAKVKRALDQQGLALALEQQANSIRER